LKLGGSALKLESELGKGSRFYFDIEHKVEKNGLEYEPLEGIKNVLVVDDNDNNRRILKRMLELKNVQIDEAESGLVALLMLQKDSDYDVIIMDYHMPIMDGIETIRKIKEIVNKNMAEQPIVMLYSSSDDEKLQAACDELKVQSRLVKPIKMQEMYRVLAQLKKENGKSQPLVQEQIAVKQKRNLNLVEGSKFIKVLIAEDNEINLFLAKTLINKIVPQAQVIETRNGKEAVNQYEKAKPDIILMDVQMPLMNGLEATKQIRLLEKDIHIPILALTAGNMIGEKEKCISAGMDDFMTKPIVKNDLADMFSKWLGINKNREPKVKESNKVQHLDKEWLNGYVPEDGEFRTDFFKLIKEGLDQSITSLKEDVDRRDLNAIKASGHKLKGTSLTAGFTELSKLAMAFELLESFDEEYVNDLLMSTIAEINVVLGLLENE
jgi:CheY-like chemotaxis protein